MLEPKKKGNRIVRETLASIHCKANFWGETFFFWFVFSNLHPADWVRSQNSWVGGKDFSKEHLPCFLGGGGHDSGMWKARSPVSPPCPVPHPLLPPRWRVQDEGPLRDSGLSTSRPSSSWPSGYALLRWILEIPHGKCSFLGLILHASKELHLKKKIILIVWVYGLTHPAHLACLTLSILCIHILFGYFVWSFKVL